MLRALTNLLPAPETDGHAGHGKPMHKVCRAIYGVDYPGGGVREGRDGSSIRARFLCRRKRKALRRFEPINGKGAPKNGQAPNNLRVWPYTSPHPKYSC